MTTADDVRALWVRVETVHTVTYFADESRAAAVACGMKGFWMGYFGFRATPLGAVGADVVIDAFYNFAPTMVERAIPDAWSFATPESLVRARSRAAMAALREVCPTVDEIAGAVVGTLRDVVTSAADDPTRPLYRANREVARPDDPVAEVWQHCTTIREHRGDGHVTALRRARLDGCEAHVLSAAEAGVPTELLRNSRGWTEDEWAAATDRLRERGLVDGDGGATDAGRDLRALIERATDAAARVLFAAAPPEAFDELMRGLEPLARGGRERAHPVPEPDRRARPGGRTSTRLTLGRWRGTLVRPVARRRERGWSSCRSSSTRRRSTTRSAPSARSSPRPGARPAAPRR